MSFSINFTHEIVGQKEKQQKCEFISEFYFGHALIGQIMGRLWNLMRRLD